MGFFENASRVELIGYLAAGLVFITFYMRTMIPLRVVGIVSNLAFISYALAGDIYPVLALHAILLPLNCYRLLQMRTLIERVREASRSDLSMEWLIPHMSRQRFKKGDVLFQKGDLATEMYLALSGSIRLVGIDQTIRPGMIIGEVGVFSPTKQRTATAVCESDMEVGSIDEKTVLTTVLPKPPVRYLSYSAYHPKVAAKFVQIRGANFAQVRLRRGELGFFGALDPERAYHSNTTKRLVL